jgi:hypothetical protein
VCSSDLFIFELGPEYYGLIGRIRFEFLNLESIDLFFNKISIYELDENIWEAMKNRMRHRLMNDQEKSLNSRLSKPVTRIPDSPWSGLISYLGELSLGNVHEKGVVEITCSSNERHQCWQVVDYDWNDCWYTANHPDSWIQFDFKEWVVCLTHYSLKSHSGGANFLLKWELKGSNDKTTWVGLDKQQTNEINGTSITKTFSCPLARRSSDFYRYIRLQQTGKASTGQDYLILANIEFFGSIVKAADVGMINPRILPPS